MSITKDEIIQRMNAFRELGPTLGGNSGRVWTLLDNHNARVRRHHSDAVQLKDVLGVDEASMVNAFGIQ